MAEKNDSRKRPSDAISESEAEDKDKTPVVSTTKFRKISNCSSAENHSELVSL